MMRNTMVLITAALVLAAVGCDEQMSYRDRTPPPNASQPARGNVEYLADSSVARDDESSASPSAVEDALRWSRKYSETAEKLVSAQQELHSAREEKQELLAQVARLQTELDRAKQELREANQMLIEMREELNHWKTNVLGYRDEMLRAQEAQLERLQEIIELLGGHVPPPAGEAAEADAGEEGAGSASAS
ncbi:MAG: hypothetical protein ACP5HU_03255 [Phycisphaerae bacterium]